MSTEIFSYEICQLEMVSQNQKQSDWSYDFARSIKETLHDQSQAAYDINLVVKKLVWIFTRF